MTTIGPPTPSTSVTAANDLLRDPTLREQLRAVFRGRARWLAVAVMLFGVAAAVFAIVAAVCFFRAEGVRAMIAWAMAFLLGVLAHATCRIWFWIAMPHYTLLGEMQRMEQQIARLTSQLLPRT